MTGAAMTPAPSGPSSGMDVGAAHTPTPSFVNSFRVAAVAERLFMHVRPGHRKDALEFFNLCLSLARGIDYSVANNEVPSRAQDLPLLLKQVCQRKSDYLLQAAIMVLMISVKNACKIGWFSDKDTGELLTLANEIGSGFCSVGDINTEPSYSVPTISKIMSRFYPLMKMGQKLAFLEVKPGYGAFVVDFHISKNTTSSPQEKIRLFVAQTDNVETSSCIISPPQVNFLLNGKGVERRTNVATEFGPQMPTNVTTMLKYGTNLLQAVGQFNGCYIIVIAFMSVMSSPDAPVLQDYVQPAVTLDSDSEIIEGPSRISLNCPISFRRIKTPVKGHACKHLWCFDFANFVEINSRRPSWRCPHCNQYVCYTDIRIDQNMVKVLREVGENVADVIISADGSWKPVLESNDHIDQPHDKTLNCRQEGPEDILPNVLDLTEGDDEMDTVGTYETEDRKPSLVNLRSDSIATNLTMPLELNNTSEVNRNATPQIEDDFWSGIFFPTYGSVTSSGSDAQTVGGITESLPTDFMLSPVLTDAVSPALNREPENFRGTPHLTTSLLQSQLPAPNNMQLQQMQFGSSIVSNEYGRLPSIPRHISRTPIAVQALPAQAPAPGLQQRSITSMNTLIPNGSSLASQTSPSIGPIADGFNTVCSDMERQQQFSRSLLNPLQVSDLASSPLQHHSTTQTFNQDRPFIPGQSVQQIVGLPAQSQLPSAYRVSSGIPSEHQNSHQQQSLNPRMSQTMSQSPNLIRSSAHFPRTQFQQGGAQTGVGHAAGTGNSQHARLRVAAQRAAQMARPPPLVPVQIQTSRPGSSFSVNADGFRASMGEQRMNMGGMGQPVSRPDGLGDLPTEQNWRPAGRMRGSLAGRAYSAALTQLMIQPTQPAQAARPPSNLTSPPSGVPSQLHVLMANSRNAHAPQTHTASMTGGSGILPDQSLGMH